jgi:hypothetical protein
MVHFLQKVLGAGWLVAAVCLVAPIIVEHELIQGDYIEHWKEKFYITISRPIWSLGVSWVIFVCVTGYGGKYCNG